MSALCPAFFIPNLESFISRLNVILRHDLTLSVGGPDNAAAQTGAGTAFGANSDQHTRAVELSTYFCVLTIRKHLLNLSGRGPSICYRRPFCRLKAPLGLSLLRCASQTRSMRFERSGRGQEPSRGHKFSILENFLSIRDFTSQTLASFPSDLVGVALVGATPLHLLSQTALPLKSPTGAFIATQTRSHPKPCSSFVPCGTNGTACRALHNFTKELSNRQEVQ